MSAFQYLCVFRSPEAEAQRAYFTQTTRNSFGPQGYCERNAHKS